MASKRQFEQISVYKKRAAERRAKSVLQKPQAELMPGIVDTEGVVTVTIEPDARSASELGGITKLVGKSKFSIPEFRRSRKQI